jgi:signal transduction histidine kinase
MNALENQFFKDFSVEGKEALLPHLKVEGFQAGVYLFHEGDVPDGVYLVVEGEIEILKTAGHREQTLGVFQPGEFLGEAAVLDGKGRSTCARARGHVVVVKVPTKPLMDVLATEPISVTIRLFQRVLTYFRRTNDLFVREVVHKEKLALVGEMAASLMHDLRNPLSGIRLASDLLKMLHNDPETVRCCDGTAIQCDRIAAMATDLLEVSRGDVKLHLQRTNTTVLLDQFQELNAEYFRHVTVKIVFEAEEAEIEVDSMRLLRLLQNLTMNAAEATADRKDALVEVKAWAEDSRLFLVVKDNGPGLPDEVVEHIFEPFSTYGKKGGTGLGLAIVKNVVEAHHGTITFNTARGQGTSFVIRLPQFASNAHEHPPIDPVKNGAKPEASRARSFRDVAGPARL